MTRHRNIGSITLDCGIRGCGATMAALLIVASAGCTEADSGGFFGPRTDGWSQAALHNVSRDAAFDAGVYAMRQWFRLEEIAPETGTIRSATEEYQQRGGTGRIRDAAIGYTNRMRRTATLVIQETQTGSVARCIVRVQRMDTADHRIFRDNVRMQDYPGDTPIDRDAGVSDAQREAWTDMPRDRALEREILNLVRDRTIGVDAATPDS